MKEQNFLVLEKSRRCWPIVSSSLLSILLFGSALQARASDTNALTFHGTTAPLSQIVAKHPGDQISRDPEEWGHHKFRKTRDEKRHKKDGSDEEDSSSDEVDTFMPQTPQPTATEQLSAPTPNVATANGLNIEGVGQGFVGPGGTFNVSGTPPDVTLSVGATQVVQWVNSSFAVFNKTTGATIMGPVKGNTIFAGMSNACATTNRGDPVVIYDKMANRWVLTQFAFASQTAAPYFQCIAVSATSDATGSYHLYSMQFSNFNDYPKMGIWPDGYYLSFNMFAPSGGFVGGEVCAMERSKMLAGQPAQSVCKSNSNWGSLLPTDLDGSTLPASGTPNFFMNLGSNALNLFKFHVDWSNTANSTFTGPTSIPVAAFTRACGNCIPQAGTSQQLDTLSGRPMFRLAYRRFSDHESLVVNHSVVTSQSASGVRWYEIRNPNGTPSVFQQSTFSPDSTARWMGSIGSDKMGNMAVGYSASSSSINPGIRYTGRLVSDALNTMQSETVLLNGTGSQTGLSRWGDYTAMSIDPVDDCTFWYTNEYIKTTGSPWHTRIGSFKFPNCGGTSSTITYETENLTVASTSGDVHRVAADPGYSNGNGTILEANATGDFVTYNVNVPEARNYDIRIGIKKGSNRGTWQFSSNGVNHGPTVDGYDPGSVFTEVDIGSVSFSSTGNKTFKFAVTGKNGSSSSFWLALDYIKLIPQ